MKTNNGMLALLMLYGFTTLSAQTITLVAGGDVEWSGVVKNPSFYYGIKKQSKKIREDGWRRLTYLASPESQQLVDDKYGLSVEDSTKHHKKAMLIELPDFESELTRNQFPLEKIAPALRDADFTFINLETPLSDSGRYSGAFRTPTSFAEALKWAGVDIVSTANNHTFDAEGQGIADTRKALALAGIKAVGTGKDLDDARKPVVLEKEGIKLAFLAYTYGVNPTDTDLGFAHTGKSGAVPLDPFLIKEDVGRIRDKVDYIILSFHWGLEHKQEIHPAAIEFAHEMIDSGADIILGHHPHVPRGVENYKGKLIIYSMGNLIFSHTHDYWMDNFLAKITLSKERIEEFEMIPIAGELQDLGQPFEIEGHRADRLLQDLKARSDSLDSKLIVNKNRGIMKFK